MISRKEAIGLAGFFGAVAIAPAFLEPFHVILIANTALYALFTLSVCAIVSYAGQFGLLQPVFATLSGYMMGIAIAHWHWQLAPAVVAGLALSMLVAAVIATFIFRLQGFYLAIGTLLLTLLVPLIVANQFEAWTNGYFGLQLSSASLGGFAMSDLATRYYVMWGLVAGVAIFFANLERTRIVRAARAVKANQATAQLAAINPWRVKAGMFMLSSLVAAMAGIMGTLSLQFIDVNTFDINLVILIFAAVIIGGRGNLWGALVGAVFITVSNQILGLFQEKGTLLYGLTVIAILVLLPDGLIALPAVVLRQWRRGRPGPELAKVLVAAALPQERLPDVDEAGSGPILELDNVTVRFDAFAAVQDVSFSLKRGSIVALLGPNGAGKTTIFNAITGYSRPTVGSVKFDGQDITGMSTYRIRRAGISRTLQNPHIFTELTVWQNIALGADFLYDNGMLASGLSLPRARRNERRIEAAACALAARVGLSEMAHRSARELSFGQSRLVDVARTLAGSAQLLLLDEPFAGLSPSMIETVKEILLDLRQSGHSILLIDHNFQHVSEICSYGVLVVGGRVSRQGATGQLLSDEVVIKEYVGV